MYAIQKHGQLRLAGVEPHQQRPGRDLDQDEGNGRRHDPGDRAKIGTLRDYTIEFEVVADNTDADWLFFLSCYDNDTVAEILILNGPVLTVGSRGARASMNVTDMTESQPLEGVAVDKCKLEVAISANAPVPYVVT